MIPISVIIMIELLVGFILLLATALISESEAWTVVIMSISNIGISLFMFWVASFPEIGVHIESVSPVWNSTAISMIGGECAIGIFILTMTFYLQSKKTDFL